MMALETSRAVPSGTGASRSRNFRRAGPGRMGIRTGLLGLFLLAGLASTPLHPARADEVDDLRQQVEQLKQQVTMLQNQMPGAGAGGGGGSVAAQQVVQMQQMSQQ